MTRKDYELIAAAIANARRVKPGAKLHSIAEESYDNAAFELAAALEKTNPAFRAGPFLAACGVSK